MEICHVGTFYSLLIYLLLPGKKMENTFFFLGDTMNLKNRPKNSFIVKSKKLRFPFTILYYDIFLKFKLHHIVKKYKLSTDIVYGQDHLPGSSYFLRYKFYLIEDGLGNYSSIVREIKRYNRKYILNKILGRTKWLGLEKNVKKIYLTGMSNIFKGIEEKVEIINLKNLWNNKREEEKQEILNLVGINPEDRIKIEKAENILITQPISEDDVVTEKEKIDLYRKIVTEFGEENLLIKPHPRELTDYKKIFPKATVIGKDFPFEIISILNIEIKNLITLFSTSIFSMVNNENINIVFYGTKVNQKLVDRFGDINLEDYKNSY